MRKLVILCGLALFCALPVGAAEKRVSVKVEKCIDGDTARFETYGTTRFLYVDTPEYTKEIEPFGKEASEYTCKRLKQAKKIELEFDGPKKDKYKRTLAWVWVDGALLQRELVDRGLVEKFYDYGTYRYEAELVKAQKVAQQKRVGLWGKSSVPVTKKKFANCTELRKVYPNGVPSTHPAYEPRHDRDKDGFACERN